MLLDLLPLTGAGVPVASGTKTFFWFPHRWTAMFDVIEPGWQDDPDDDGDVN